MPTKATRSRKRVTRSAKARSALVRAGAKSKVVAAKIAKQIKGSRTAKVAVAAAIAGLATVTAVAVRKSRKRTSRRFPWSR